MTETEMKGLLCKTLKSPLTDGLGEIEA